METAAATAAPTGGEQGNSGGENAFQEQNRGGGGGIELDRGEPGKRAVPIEHPKKEKPAPKEQTQEEAKYKVVFKGKEFEEPESKIRKYIGLAPEDVFDPKAHINTYQRARLYEDKLNEVERMRIDHQKEVDEMKADFGGWLKNKAGVDPMAWAYQVMQQQEQMAQMSPEERQWAEYQSQLQAREQYVAQKEQEYQQQAYQAQVSDIYQGHVKGMTKAIQSMGYPMDETFLAMAADHIEAQMQKGRRNISYEEAAEWTLNKFKTSSRSVIGKLKGEALLKFLGDDVVREVRQTILTQPNGRTQTAGPGKIGIEYKQQNTNPQQMSKAEYKKYLEQRMQELDGKK